MAELWCPECAGEFPSAKALYWHLRKEEKYSHEDAFEETGKEMREENGLDRGPRVWRQNRKGIFHTAGDEWAREHGRKPNRDSARNGGYRS